MTQKKGKKILVTSALPYVNNVPHLGTLVCVISADVYTRFLRLKNADVVSVLGTDEHGTTAEVKAIEEGLTPKQLTDKYFKIHKEIYEWFNCGYDCFGRTSSKENWEIAQEIFIHLDKNGYIKEQTIKQAFCENCKKFLADRFVQGTCPKCGFEDAKGDQCDNCGVLLTPEELKNPKCSICNSKPVFKETKHLFIDLPKLQPKLESWMKTSEKAWSQNAKTMTHAWLKDGLKLRAITRDLEWGIKVPKKGFENKVFYSWFDAPIGYISITKEHKKNWETYWKDQDTELVQFMGKDNIPFHTILFPAFLIGSDLGYTLVNKLSVNEYLNYESGKFSKSRNTGVFGDDAKETGIHADIFRYYLLVNRPEKTDTEFTWKDFQEKLNTELVGNFGNLVNRTLTFLNRFFDGKTGKITQKLDYKKEVAEIEKAFEEIELKKALKLIMALSKKGNQYFQEEEPWQTFKTDKKKAENALTNLATLVKDLSILIQPFMPKTSESIQEQLKVKDLTWEDIGKPLENHKVGQAKLLFSKLEDEQVEELKIKFSGQKTSPFAKLNLKVAQIEEIDDVEGADKLYKMQISLGKEKRQIVAGIKKYYDKNELKNKKIVVVTNLETAMLRNNKSEGMLLACDDGKDVGLLYAEKSHPGDQVFIEGVKPGNKIISFKEFLTIPLKGKDGKPFFEGQALKTAQEIIKIDKVKGGQIK
jgi:methionyl-tRNA synthetase